MSNVIELLPGWVVVTEATHPTVFLCFETISADCGMGCGHTNYSVPPEWVRCLLEYEVALKVLRDEDLQTFCIGEASEVQALIGTSTPLQSAHRMLDAFFDDWNQR